MRRQQTNYRMAGLAAAAIALSLVLAGCAGRTAPQVINISGLIPITATKRPNVHAYETPDFDRSQYHALLISPATVYHGDEADFHSVDEEDRERIAAMLTSEFKRVLGPDFRVVDAPGPGVVRIDLVLVGINTSKPVLSTALRLTPVGLVLSAAHGVRGKPAAFTGDINFAGVAYDSQSGKVLAAVQALINPSAVNLTSGLTPLRAAELSTTVAAEAFRDYLYRVRSGQ